MIIFDLKVHMVTRLNLNTLLHETQFNLCWVHIWDNDVTVVTKVITYCTEDLVIHINLLLKAADWCCTAYTTVSGQLPSEENCPQLGLGFGSGLGLVLGLGSNQIIAPEERSPRLGLGVGCVSFRVTGTIFLGGNCPRTHPLQLSIKA